jgi:hypothetical protein
MMIPASYLGGFEVNFEVASAFVLPEDDAQQLGHCRSGPMADDALNDVRERVNTLKRYTNFAEQTPLMENPTYSGSNGPL